MSHVKLIFWDLGGQQELRSLWDKVPLLATIIMLYLMALKRLYLKAESFYSQLFLNKHLYKTDILVKQTPRVGPAGFLYSLYLTYNRHHSNSACPKGVSPRGR